MTEQATTPPENESPESESPENESPAKKSAEKKPSSGLLDLIPLVVFFAVYALVGIMEATGAAMLATVIVVIFALVKHGTVPKMALLSGGLLMVFGGLTLYLNDETFIKMKPTIVLGLFALLAIGGRLIGWSLSKTLMGSQMQNVSETIWRTLDLRFGLFYVALAVTNEAVWRTVSTDIWVNFKVFGITALTIGFVLTQMPMLKKAEEGADAANAAD